MSADEERATSRIPIVMPEPEVHVVVKQKLKTTAIAAGPESGNGLSSAGSAQLDSIDLDSEQLQGMAA